METERLIREYTRSRDRRILEEITRQFTPLVYGLARRYARPGVPVEDLAQSGWVALIRALDRYDPSMRVRFGTYAWKCVAGEIKRHFRDRTWSVSVPRRVRELASELDVTTERLTRRLQREPADSELAAELKVPVAEIGRARQALRAYMPVSLEDRRGHFHSPSSAALADRVGEPDPETETLLEQAPLRQALETLPARERQLLRLRFWDGCSQRETGQHLNLSQMHVSRLERQALRRLRVSMEA